MPCSDVPKLQIIQKDAVSSLTIFYGLHETSLGLSLIAVTQDAICYLSFLNNTENSKICTQTVLADHIQNPWKNARWIYDDSKTAALNSKIWHLGVTFFEYPLLVSGTPFQVEVWQALLSIPRGETWSYSQVAAFIKRPSATRATAHAIASNTIGCLIPCHRVIKKSGAIHKYAYGTWRKEALLKNEQSNT